MPHDRNGEVLKVGDTVYIPVRVIQVHEDENFCNLNVETLWAMPGLKPLQCSQFTLNTKQVEKNPELT